MYRRFIIVWFHIALLRVKCNRGICELETAHCYASTVNVRDFDPFFGILKGVATVSF